MQEYNEARKGLFERIGESSKMVLATSVNNIVSARTVSVLSINGLFYFQTDRSMDKAREIAVNSNVALCLKEIQIKGICRDIGNPKSDKNSFFIKKFQELFPSAYAKYSHLDNETVFEIKPTMAKTWRYINECQCVEYIDFLKEEYRCEQYKL